MKRRKKMNLILIIFVIVIVLGLGYAYLTTTLSINGTTDVDSNTWNVYWDNVQVTSGSVTGAQVTTAPTIDTDKTTVSFQVRLSKPGEYYEFTVDAKNTGSIDAMVDTVTNTTNIPTYLKYTVTYIDEIAIAQNHLLASNTTEKYKVRIEYRTDINANQLPATNQTLSLQFTVTYRQANENAIAVDHSFNGHSWETIINNIRSGNTNNYNVGDTKTVDMGSLGTHTLRIANKSTPSECSTTGFSQTACGFVLEFADIITTHRMNPYTSGSTNGDGNKGGWYYSEMRTFINTDIDNALPQTLSDSIIQTRVISGRGQGDTSNFETDDKIYLLDSKEVYGDSYTASWNKAKDKERQLDYYANIGATINNVSGVIKNYNNTNTSWWLRSATTNNREAFCIISSDGGWSYCHSSTDVYGVSPAFRLG